MKVTIDAKQFIEPLRPMLAEEMACNGCLINGDKLSMYVTDFTVFLGAYIRFLGRVSRNGACISSGLVDMAISYHAYVSVESETTLRRIGVSLWYEAVDQGIRYKYERDE